MTVLPEDSLEAALRRAISGRWRNSPSSVSQARLACLSLMHCRWPEGDHEGLLALCPVAAVTSGLVRQAVASWYASGLTPATINKRLSCLSALGVQHGGYEKDPIKLKWWFKPEDWERALCWALDESTGPRPPERKVMLDYIKWATTTGLRVEESLRLHATDFSADCREVTVPGLKTISAQATLALDSLAVEVASRRIKTRKEAGEGLFPLTYDQLHTLWDSLRTTAGWPKEATLKGLRRTAARFLHVDRGMPLDMVRQYLRHEDIETTMGYLRLTGGYSLKEQRGYLK